MPTVVANASAVTVTPRTICTLNGERVQPFGWPCSCGAPYYRIQSLGDPFLTVRVYPRVWNETKKVFEEDPNQPPLREELRPSKPQRVWGPDAPCERFARLQQELLTTGKVPTQRGSIGRGFIPFDMNPPTPEEQEWAAICQSHPHIAERFRRLLKAKPSPEREPEPQLFDLGPILVTHWVYQLGVDIRGLLAQHRQGNLGSMGELTGYDPGEKAPIACALDGLPAAWYAVHHGHGLVQSLHEFAEKVPVPTRPPDVVRVVSRICSQGNATLCWCPNRDVTGLPG